MTDSTSGAPLTASRVSVLADDGTSVAAATTNRLGGALLLELPAGRYAIEITRFGYETIHLTGQAVEGNAVSTVAVRLQASAFSLDPVLVTAARASETTLATPAAVSVVTRDVINRRTVLSPVDLIADQPGVEVIRGGLLQRRYTSRGNNFGTSSQMLTLTDYRYNVLPSNNHNLPYSLATNDADIERVEQVRGPAGALYGPSTSRGVLHIITRSPFESEGTSMSLTGGGRSVFQGQFRHAARIGDQFAFKISGRYMQGDDWEVTDPAEIAARADLIAGGADPATLKVGARDFGISVAGGEAALEWRGEGGTTVTANLGLNQIGNAFDPLTFGGTPIQIIDAQTGYGQLRVTRGRFFGNVFVTGMRADSLFITSNGYRLAEKSTSYVAQLQHGADIGQAVSLTYGTEVSYMNSVTDGTQHTFTEDRDNLTEVGGYVLASVALSPKLDLSAAARVSYHSVLGDAVVTPNLAIVYRPEPGHAVRATYARAAFTPGVGLGFADFPLAALGPYNLRLTERFRPHTFRRDCGGPCMRSPFAPDPRAFLQSDATLLWPAIVAILQAEGIDLSGLPAPTAADVATILASLNLNTFAFDPIAPDAIQDIAPIQRLTINTFEIGYKGIFEDRFSVTADVHYNEMGPVWANVFVGTPSVFYDPLSLEAYLGQFMPSADAGQLAGVIAGIPVGTVTPEQAGDPHALMLVEPQEGQVEYFGLDLGFTANLTHAWQARASYSWVSKDIVPDIAGSADFLFLNPKHRGALSLDYHAAEGRLDFSLGGRFVGSYPAVDFLSQSVAEAFWVADARVGYRLREDVTFSLALDNVFDNEFAEMPGLPVMGRLILARVQVEF